MIKDRLGFLLLPSYFRNIAQDSSNLHLKLGIFFYGHPVLPLNHCYLSSHYRLKREQNRKHIEQAVKERQKMTDFQAKEKTELAKEHDQVMKEIEEEQDKVRD